MQTYLRNGMIYFYYDKIIEGQPAPNGSRNIDLTKDARRVPYYKGHDAGSCIAKFTTFYFTMKSHKVNVKLFTNKETTKNLYYPIELNHSYYGWNRSWINLISAKAKKLIRKKKMRLLILAPRVTGNAFILSQMKIRIDELVESGIPKDRIHIVLGELKDVYKPLLDLKNVYGFDWWQVYMQTVCKVRSGKSSLHWISHNDNFLRKSKDVPLDYGSNPPKKLFNVVPSHHAKHDITLLLELANRNLLEKGSFTFDHNNYKLNDTDPKSLFNARKSSVETEHKKGLIKNLEQFSNGVIDQNDKLSYDEDEYNNSVLSIICEENDLQPFGYYSQELAALRAGPHIWQHIALGHPFMVLGTVGTVGYLNNEGYFSYNDLIRQTYDLTYDPAIRSEQIVDNIEFLDSLSTDELNERIKEVMPFVKKNREKFFNKRMEGKFIQLFVDMRCE